MYIHTNRVEMDTSKPRNKSIMRIYFYIYIIIYKLARSGVSTHTRARREREMGRKGETDRQTDRQRVLWFERCTPRLDGDFIETRLLLFFFSPPVCSVGIFVWKLVCGVGYVNGKLFWLGTVCSMPLSGTKRRAEGRVKCEMDGEWGWAEGGGGGGRRTAKRNI